MDNAHQTKPKRGIAGILFLKIIPAILVTWMVITTLAMVISVRKQVNHFRTRGEATADSLTWSQEEWRLLRDKSFLEARIVMAGNDSIGLTIDFPDSLVRLENKGVILREIRFSEAEISRFFRSFRPRPYAAVFSRPFTISEIEGSIVKEPIQVKKAPRDSTEAAQNVTKIDTSGVEFVEWHLQLDSSIVVSFVQSEGELGSVDWPTIKYRIRRHYKTLLETNRALLGFRLPEYKPEVTLFIPAGEAKSFYRALPPTGEVALKF
jgi:hypothetical protein